MDVKKYIFVSLFLVIHSVAGGLVFAQTEIAYTPNIEKHPVALSTNARNAALMLYMQALPADEGSLKYQWYTSTVTTDYPLPLTNEAIAAIKADTDAQTIPGETHYNLSTTTPDAAGNYYYWCRVTNTKGTQPFAESNLTKVIVIDKTLEPQLMNGGFQEFWDFDGTTAGYEPYFDNGIRAGRPFIANGRGRSFSQGNYSLNPIPDQDLILYDGVLWDDNNDVTAAWIRTSNANYHDHFINTSPSGTYFFALPPADGNRTKRGIKYWDTTHAYNGGTTTYTGYSNGKTAQLMVATSLGHNQTYLDPKGHNRGYIEGDPVWYSYPYVVELNPDEASSLYQEIATVPGKIYEWSIDHAPRDGRNATQMANENTMAVIIGQAMNSETDYTSAGLTGPLNRWDQGNGSYTITNAAVTQYMGWARDEVYPYGSLRGKQGVNYNTTTRKAQSYFLDIIDNLGTQNNLGLNQSYVSHYYGRDYFVYIGTANRGPATPITITDNNANPRTQTYYEMPWTQHSGVYSVPEGQGISVFSFVGIVPAGNSGNILDNIVFKSGTPPQFDINMFYSGLVTLSAVTRPDYVYGIAEVRGSAVYAPDTSFISVTFNDNPITPYDFGDASIEYWYYPQATGTITFSNMIPGKTYRIVGIPRGAVSGQNELNTNRTPSLVLDDGYYEEITIQGTSEGNNNQMPTVGARDTMIFLTNSNPGVEYALLDNQVDSGMPGRVVWEWRTGLGLETGQSLFFTGLKRNHCYLLVVRPTGWNEITYEIAAKSEGRVIVCTPYIDDIQVQQVSRVRNADGTDKIIIRKAEGNISSGISDLGEHVIARRNEYHYYNGQTGQLSVESGKFIPETSGGGEVQPLFVEFDGLDADVIYHMVVRDTREPRDIGGNSYLVGVRVYPIVPPYQIDYLQERVAYDGNRPIPNKELVEKVEYRMWANDADSTWLIGDADSFVAAPGNDYINMGQRQGGNPSLLDRIWILEADTAVIESRFRDLWPAAQFPSVYPLSHFKVPRRPEAPVAADCDESVVSLDYFIDYPNEKIIVNRKSLAYSTNNGANFTTLLQYDEVNFGTLGWSGAERTVPLRIPAVVSTDAEEGSFASESNMQIILGRGPAPLEPYARIVDGASPYVEILNLEPDSSYQYRLQGESAWSSAVSGVDIISGLPYGKEGAEIDYEIRYAASCEKPASLYRLLSMPLSILPVNFGNVVYGYDPEDHIEDIIIRNVAGVEVDFSDIILINCTKNDTPLPPEEGCDLFEIVGAKSGVVPEAAGGVEGENRDSKIKPKEGLPVGTYRATLELIYDYDDNDGKRTMIEVFLNVTKATRENPLEAVSYNVTDSSFIVKISFIDDIPEDAIIKYRINDNDYKEGNKGEVVIDTITGLAPAASYTVTYLLKESENYYETIEKVLTVCTAFPSENVTYVSYIGEMLYLNPGLLEENYAVRVNGNIVDEDDMPYNLSTEADLGDITISVSQIGPQTNSNCEYPPSVPFVYTVTGRADAPEVTLTGEGNDIINVADVSSRRFEYRRGRRTEFWTLVTGASTASLRWGSYQVRYTATPSVFASKNTTVFILPALEPVDRKLYVNIDVDPEVSNGNGSSWKNATPSLSAALEYTRIRHPSPVDSIFVATGQIPYTSEISTADDVAGEHNRAFVLPDSVVISGGYDASTGLPNAAPTILSGKLEDITGNSFHVVVAGNAAQTTLNRFVITGGRAEGEGEVDIGLSNEGVEDAMEHQTIFRRHGAGLYVSGSSHLKLVNVLIHSNEAEGNGGGIYIENHTSTVLLTNVTISGNSAKNGGGVYNEGVNSFLDIENTIIYGNTATDEEPEFHDTDDTFRATYSLVKDKNFDGTGNLDGSTNDPLFVDPATNDYRLQRNSAAHDTGNTGMYSGVLGLASDFNALLDNSTQTDAGGKVRVRGLGIDMGAFEFQDKHIVSLIPEDSEDVNAAPLTGGTRVVIEVAGAALDDGVEPEDINNLTVTIAGAPATVVKVEGNLITCIAGPATMVTANSKVEIKYTENATDTELTGFYLSDFTYYPVVFIENGKWSEYFKWEGQTEELIMPYTGADIYIKANMLQDIDVDMDSITVYPGKAYTIGSGKILKANVFTLKDDASFLDNNPNNVNMQAVLQNVEHTLAKGRNWYVSSPVAGSGTLTASPESDRIEQYDETKTSGNWEAGNGLETGRGYTIYSAASDMAVKFSGKYNDDNQVSSLLTNTPSNVKHGFNLVGNPFPSYWRWTETTADVANLYSTIWYRTFTGGVYEFWSYNASGDVAAMPGREETTPAGSYSLGYIPPMQSFWVRVKDGQTGTLTFMDNLRTHADHGSNQLKSAEMDTETRPLLRLAVHNDSMTDETVVYADREAKKDFDTYDSDKWFVDHGAEIFTLPASSSRELVINGLPEITAGTEVTLGFRADEGGAFSFRAKEILNLDTLDVFLLDKWRNIQFDLRSGDYDFTASSELVTDRFRIVFAANDLPVEETADLLLAYPGKNGEITVVLYLRDQEGNDATVSVFDISGRKVAEQTVVVGERTMLNGTFTDGVYVLRSGNCVTKTQVSSNWP